MHALPWACVTRLHGHLQCDTPGCGAITPEHSERASLWAEVQASDDAAAAHLCERCVDKRDKGVLVDDFSLECARCGRSTRDGDIQWWGVPADPENRSTAHGVPPPQITVCDDCKGDGDSFVT